MTITQLPNISNNTIIRNNFNLRMKILPIVHIQKKYINVPRNIDFHAIVAN